MANPFQAIDSSLIATGRLWTPALTRLFMARDWGLGEYPFDFNYELHSEPDTTFPATWANVGAKFYVHFPTTWADDDSYGEIDLTFVATFEAKRTASTDVDFRLDPDGGTLSSRSNDTVINNTYTEYTLQVIFEGLPTGTIGFDFQVNGGEATTTFQVRRTFGANTDCYLQIN